MSPPAIHRRVHVLQLVLVKYHLCNNGCVPSVRVTAYEFAVELLAYNRQLTGARSLSDSAFIIGALVHAFGAHLPAVRCFSLGYPAEPD